MSPKNKKNSILKQKQPWVDNHNDIWLASTISLFRNIEKFKFPGKMSADRRKQIIPLLTNGLLSSPELIEPEFLKGEDVSPEEKEYLVEHFLSTYSFQEAYGGEGFIVDNSGRFLATVNIHDHIHLHIIDVRGELEQAWNKLVKIEMNLGKNLAYAFSPRFGFLTANSAFCGTGLTVALYLQPSALIHSGKISEIIEHNKDKTIEITGLQGNPTEIIGDVLLVKNHYTLGLTEENIISSIRTFATKLLVEEGSMRNELKQNDSVEIKDKVSRAFGVLMHSYQIDPIEALNAISLLKLGSELGWLEGTTTAALNELFFHCRRGHLIQHFKKDIKQEELAHKRAEYIHQTLKDVNLKI